MSCRPSPPPERAGAAAVADLGLDAWRPDRSGLPRLRAARRQAESGGCCVRSQAARRPRPAGRRARRALRVDLRAVHGSDALHDRPAQPAALLAAAEHAEEALAQALQLGLGQAGAAVLDRSRTAAALAAPRDLHRAPRRAVAHGVVDQVAHQHGQQRGVALHRAAALGASSSIVCRLPEPAAPARRPRAHQRRRSTGCQRRRVGGLQPRQRQQLLDQARGAVAALPAWPAAHAGAARRRPRPAPPGPGRGWRRSACATRARRRR